MTKMTVNESMIEAIPTVQLFAATLKDKELALLCQQLVESPDKRLALWTFMITWCAEFNGVAQQLQRSSNKLTAPLSFMRSLTNTKDQQ